MKSTPGCAKAAKAVEIIGKVRNVLKAEVHFIKSGEYAKLPTEAEEAIERSEERSEENEEMLEELEKSVTPEEEEDTAQESQEVSDEENSKVEKNAEESQKGEILKDKEIDGLDDKHKEPRVKKKKDPLDEIEEICSR